MARFFFGLLAIAAALNLIAAQVFPVSGSPVRPPSNPLRLSAEATGHGSDLGGAPGAAAQFGIRANPAAVLLSFVDMAPEDQITAPVTISNEGSFPLRYFVNSIATNPDGKGLMSRLLLTVKSGVSDCTSSGYMQDGSVLYGPAPLGSPEGLLLLAAAGRALSPGESETLCFSVLLPSDTPNEFQGAATAATFDFVAVQSLEN